MKLVSKFILGTFYFPEQTRHLISRLPPNSVQATFTVYPVWLCFDSCHVTLWILRRTLELVLQTTCRAGQFPLIIIVKRTPGATVTNTKCWIVHSSVIPKAKSLPIWFNSLLVLQVRPEWSDHCSCSLSHGLPECFIHSALLVHIGDCLGCILSTSIFGALNTASSGSELSERNVNFTSKSPPCAQ